MVPVAGPNQPFRGPMPYTAPISRPTPSCFLFLLDQSGSMNESLSLPGEPPLSRAQALADSINRLLANLVVQNTQGSEVWDRFHVGVILYNGNGASVPPAFGGLRALSEVAANPLRIETRSQEFFDGAGGIGRREVRFPIWFDPQAGGGTPMCEALALAQSLLQPWCEAHPDSFPPIVMNITDGESTDGDPLEGLERLKTCGTRDGSVLVFNALLSNGTGAGAAYPTSSESFPAGPLQSMVTGTSVIPETMRSRAEAILDGRKLQPGARGVVIQAHILDVIRLLDIGTRAPLG